MLCLALEARGATPFQLIGCARSCHSYLPLTPLVTISLFRRFSAIMQQWSKHNALVFVLALSRPCKMQQQDISCQCLWSLQITEDEATHVAAAKEQGHWGEALNTTTVCNKMDTVQVACQNWWSSLNKYIFWSCDFVSSLFSPKQRFCRQSSKCLQFFPVVQAVSLWPDSETSWQSCWSKIFYHRLSQSTSHWRWLLGSLLNFEADIKKQKSKTTLSC